MREKDIEAYLYKRVLERGGMIRKTQWIGRRGAPDRVVFLPGGKTIWVELKATGKKPEPHQAREHMRMRSYGQRVEVIDSYAGVDELLPPLTPSYI